MGSNMQYIASYMYLVHTTRTITHNKIGVWSNGMMMVSQNKEELI